MKNLLYVLSVIILIVDIRAQELLADGGYQTSFTPCMEQWTFKEKLADGTNQETLVSGCVSIEDFLPYPYYQSDQQEIQNLLEPRDGRTDKTRWCAVLRDVYNPTPQRTLSNRLNWGYCLDASTSEPTALATTVSPTSFPTMLTEQPSASPDQVETDPPTISESTQTEAPTSTEASPQPPNDNSGSQVEDKTVTLENWTYLGVGVAGTLVIVAVILTVVVTRSMKKEVKVPIDDEPVNEADLEDSSDITRN